jgi:hypothetical protein
MLAWYRNIYAPAFSLDYLSRLAGKVNPGADGLGAKPYANLCPGMTGFYGQHSCNYDHGHYVRALMESVSATLLCLLHQLCGEPLISKNVPITSTPNSEHTKIAEKDGEAIPAIRRVQCIDSIAATGGGARSDTWLQIKRT